MTTAPLPQSAVADAVSPDNASVRTPVQPDILDADAIRRLRELDPTGASHLLTRLLNAFDASLNRLLPQLVQARDQADATGVRLVAHTLKSSSATVGAMRLSRLCAEVESLANQSRLGEAAVGIQQMLSEVQAVRESLRCLAAADHTSAGAA